MGIPHLKRHLEPYSQRNVVTGREIVIDGPAFAYHILHLCLRGTRDSPFDQPGYQYLGETAIRWLDKLVASGNTIAAIYFDGFLPRSKKDERMKRVLQASKKLSDYHMAYSSSVPPGKPERQASSGANLFPSAWGADWQRRLPPPPFAVPAVLEALKNSELYGPLTKVMAGEADVYCAKHAVLYGATVLTSDSDLLVHSLGEKSSVIYIKDLEAEEGKESTTLRAPEFRLFDICQRLSIDTGEGPLALAFDLSMDPYQSFDAAVKRAKQRTTISQCPEEYSQFREPYQLLDVCLESTVSVSLDPRISEIALAWPNMEPHEEDAAKTPLVDEGITMYLPLILDSPARSSAWEPSKPIRTLAYSLLQLPTSCLIPSAVEFRRIQSPSKGTRIEPHEVLDIESHSRALCSMIAGLVKKATSFKMPSRFWGVALSIYLDISMSESQGKTRSLAVQVLQEEANGTLDELRWEFLHFAAQVQGTFYSLRMLQQLLSYVALKIGSEPASRISDLQHILSPFPPLSRFPSLLDIKEQLREARAAGGWEFLIASFELSREMAGEISRIGEMPTESKKKRKRKSEAADRASGRTSSRNPFDVLATQ